MSLYIKNFFGRIKNYLIAENQGEKEWERQQNAIREMEKEERKILQEKVAEKFRKYEQKENRNILNEFDKMTLQEKIQKSITEDREKRKIESEIRMKKEREEWEKAFQENKMRIEREREKEREKERKDKQEQIKRKKQREGFFSSDEESDQESRQENARESSEEKNKKRYVKNIFLTPDEIKLFQQYGLDISDIDSEKIKKMFQNLRFKTHPDRGGNSEEFKKVQKLYEQRYRFAKKSKKHKKSVKKSKKSKKSKRNRKSVHSKKNKKLKKSKKSKRNRKSIRSKK